MNCFKCEKVLDNVFKDTPYRQPDRGLTFSAPGNYGSRVYDPVHQAPRLVVWICDDCVVKHKDLVQVMYVKNPEPEEVWMEFDPDQEYY
jgi:hypothetical protein